MKRQQITRIPPYWPGDWVKIKNFPPGALGSDLSGAVRRVKSVTAGLYNPDQHRVIWHVHFDDGRYLEWHLIERHATVRERSGR